MMLQLNNACKKFGNITVLNQVNLTIHANTIVGVAGVSGSGKSTLLRCMQQLEALDAGHIDFKGKSGFMFQDFQLFPHMTVFKNLVYAPILHQTIENHENKAMELLEILGIKEKAQVFPQALSGGQKQRVALARSLMMHPDILLCDEPTSGLDMATIDDVIALLRSVKRMGVTMVIASHDLEFLTEVAERVVMLKAGHIVADIQISDLHNPLSYLKQKYQG
jgi:polar amino acid transport system ATP-binding protein